MTAFSNGFSTGFGARDTWDGEGRLLPVLGPLPVLRRGVPYFTGRVLVRKSQYVITTGDDGSIVHDYAAIRPRHQRAILLRTYIDDASNDSNITLAAYIEQADPPGGASAGNGEPSIPTRLNTWGAMPGGSLGSLGGGVTQTEINTTVFGVQRPEFIGFAATITSSSLTAPVTLTIEWWILGWSHFYNDANPTLSGVPEKLEFFDPLTFTDTFKDLSDRNI